MQYLIDTGVLLRLFDRTDPNHVDIHLALQSLRQRSHTLAVSTQNIAEFWNVSTRPRSARGGYGQTVLTTERRVQFFERFGLVHQENTAVYSVWRKLLVDYAIQGLAVHDARLVAMMKSLGIVHIVTLNKKDFARYPDIVALLPSDIITASSEQSS
ncbi:MAG: type II toxin-antitoxin system VapC family toxin [Bythopirellula sp.]|nr:type II toxin-antitoxin system VapC family toxin [Bythopirellula sp.]